MSNYTFQLARNICADLPVCSPGFVAPAEGSLACTNYGNYTEGGFPAAGGRLQFQFWSKICNGLTPSLSYYIINPIYLSWCAEQPEQDEEWDATKWVTNISYFTTRQSTSGTVGQYRAWAVLNSATQTEINVTLHVQGLDQVDGVNVWNNWLTVTNTMPIQAPYQKIQGNAFKSNPEYISISPSQSGGGKGDIYFISMNAGIQPLIIGCTGSYGNVCNLWDGNTMKTCFRVLIVDKSNVDFPFAALLGQNRTPCGTMSSPDCGCDECTLVSTSPVVADCLNNADPQFSEYIYTGWEPVGSVQSIQIATNTNGWQIAAKTVNGVLWFVWKYYTDVTWYKSQGTKVQDYNPTIYIADDPSSPVKLYFYVTLWPSPETMPLCATSTTTPAPGLAVAFTEPPVLAQEVPFVNLSIEEKRAFLKQKRGGCGCGPTPKFEG